MNEKLASSQTHAAEKAAAMSMQQDFCCMVQTCLIGLMHVCVSIIVAAKLLHRADARMCVHQCCSKPAAPMIQQCMAGPFLSSTHICSSFVATKLTRSNLAYTSAAVTCSSFDAWLLWHEHMVIGLCSKTAAPSCSRCMPTLMYWLTSFIPKITEHIVCI